MKEGIAQWEQNEGSENEPRNDQYIRLLDFCALETFDGYRNKERNHAIYKMGISDFQRLEEKPTSIRAKHTVSCK